MGSLEGKKAIVTGAGQGIGRAIAEDLAGRGCSVALHYFSSSKGAEELKSKIIDNGGKAECFQADLTKENDAKNMIESAAEFLKGVDVLVNNTGDLVKRVYLGELNDECWDRIMDVNVRSMMYITKFALPHLEKSAPASIVNLASLAGRKGGHPGSLLYSTAKGAVLTWTRSLSAELGPKGIRVNAVAPGLILGTSFHATHTTKKSADATISQIPLGRAGTPEDVARTVSFLASEYDGFITGATIDLNGGVYCA